MVVLFIVWLGGALLVMSIADERGRGQAMFFILSVVASPLVGYATLVALPDLRAEARLREALREEANRIIAGLRP